MDDIQDNPTLARDIQALCHKPEFARLKRHVFAEYGFSAKGAYQLSELIAAELRSKLLEFDPQRG